MAQIEIGQRVQVIDGGLPQYKQCGTVVSASSSSSWYVQLDGNTQPGSPTFFHVEELQAVEPAAIGPDQMFDITAEITA